MKPAELDEQLLRQRVVPCLLQCGLHTLQSQNIDGSWGKHGPHEETAYAILTLVNFLDFPLAGVFRPQIMSGIDRGRRFIEGTHSAVPEYIWIEKVTYGSVNLSKAYEIAALSAPLGRCVLQGKARDLCMAPSDKYAALGRSISDGVMS